VETTFVSQTDVAEWRAALRPNTRLLFAETPTNPLTEVCDIAALAAIATRPARCWRWTTALPRPRCSSRWRWGRPVIHSGTKYLDGQGRVMAGAVCGTRKLIDEVFAPLIRSAGMVLSPFNAWVVLKGMETLACA
jgi:O-succinylhomoserine sulfhydrylase